ncbi:response regulator [Pontibacter rugosus]|uniref:Response regulator n=1 Tax=Pontibacter rugosus TaxID=1745966 RepID=A0ABW3SR30_9BACT
MYKKVFIVDDDEVSIFLTETVLVTENFALEYSTFLNPAEALEHLLQLLTQGEQNLPEVLFLDLNMPFMSGWDFLDALKPYNQQLKQQCKIYILTSSVDICEMERSKNYSILAGFLHKPVGDDILHVLKTL